eukprot:gnl/MRDRNA2_/MRDRNA2_114066_c0_seq1.p1 gnl/MRDRNA2_/MRDRNA2_114066_c0~~gnl/MRDRNA2_/MRDRNA2_114066_c0_seq1.p1  ORF type:complete len:380 (-),score=60.68 gnl/MRDRNA2_/MRDRNA2_114066_c0_seq1:68-1207(-)
MLSLTTACPARPMCRLLCRGLPTTQHCRFVSTTPSVSDLAQQHKPIGKLFKQPESVEEWKQYVLSSSQLQEFNDKGFLAGVRILSDEQVTILQEELEPLYDRSHPSAAYWYAFDCDVPTADPRDRLFHSLGAWRITPGFHDICWAPAFRMAALQLMGGSYRLLHDQLVCKPAHDGEVVSWHQDYSYWTWTKPCAHLTCWIGLDDVTVESGCLWYVPGSHKWGLLPMTGLAGDMNAVKEVLDDEQVNELDNNRLPAVLPRGYAVFHHPFMMHGSYGNSSANQRRATVINIMRDGVVFNADGRDMGNFPTLPNDVAMGGSCYPLLVGGDAQAEEELKMMTEAAGSLQNAEVPLDMESFEKCMQQVEERQHRAKYQHKFHVS